jgi:hypothetical protein
MRKPIELLTLLANAKVLDLCYQNNDTALLVLLADNVSVDADFLANLIVA